jgi:hypothetical protein
MQLNRYLTDDIIWQGAISIYTPPPTSAPDESTNMVSSGWLGMYVSSTEVLKIMVLVESVSDKKELILLCFLQRSTSNPAKTNVSLNRP